MAGSLPGRSDTSALRTALGNAEARACVARMVRHHLGAWLADNPHVAVDVVRRATWDTARG